MNRRLLAVLGACAAAGILAFFLFRGGSSDSAAPTRAPDQAHPDRAVPGAALRTGPSTAPTRTVPLGGTAESDDHVVTYQREDGTEVRDHRAHPGGWIRPALPYPSQSKVSSLVVSSVMKEVRPLVLGCLANVPDSAFEADAVIITRVELAIDDQGDLTVKELGPAGQGMDATASAAAFDCIKKSAGQVHAHVTNPAVDDATIALTFRPLDYRRHQ